MYLFMRVEMKTNIYCSGFPLLWSILFQIVCLVTMHISRTVIDLCIKHIYSELHNFLDSEIILFDVLVHEQLEQKIQLFLFSPFPSPSLPSYFRVPSAF